MSFLAFCTFDLKNARNGDYEKAYADLDEIGLSRVVVSRTGKEVVIPTTAAIGKFEGSSVAAVGDDVRASVQQAFKARGFKSEIFVVVGVNGTWRAVTT